MTREHLHSISFKADCERVPWQSCPPSASLSRWPHSLSLVLSLSVAYIFDEGNYVLAADVGRLIEGFARNEGFTTMMMYTGKFLLLLRSTLCCCVVHLILDLRGPF